MAGRQGLSSKLAKAQRFKKAQARVADLEAQVVTETVEALRRLLQTTLDAFPANTTVLDPDGTIITVNLPWKHFADENDTHSPTHYLGSNYLTVCDTAAGPMAEEAAAAAAGIRAVIAGQRDDFYLEYPCHSPTQERWFILRVTPFAEPAPRRVVVAHINITERKMAEKAEREQRLLAEALRDSLAVLTTSLKVETVMQQLLAYSATVIPSEAGVIILFEGNQGRVAYARGHTAEAEAFFKATLIQLDSGKFAQGYHHQAAYLAADTHSTPGWISFPVTAWVRSSIGVPIILRGETIGLLIADSGIPNRFQPKDAERLQTFAQYAALALENVHHVDHLEQRVRERTTELQAEKERVEAILNNSGDGILLVHPDFTIQQTNAAFNRLFACETDAYFNQPLTALFQTQEDDLITKTIQSSVAEGQVVNLEVRACGQDRTEFDAELTIGFIKKGGFVCSIRDITQRKQTEAALQKSAAEIHDLYNHAPCGYHSLNQDGVIVQINDTELRWLGYNRDEVINKLAIKDIITPESVKIFQKSFPILKERGWLHGLEFDIIRKDSSIMHLLLNATAIYDEKGQYLQSRSSVFDITSLKQAQQALVESEARYRLLTENIGDVIIKSDINGLRTFVTPSATTLTGYSPKELIEGVTLELVHPDDRLASESIVLQALNSAESSCILTQRVHHKEGHYVWVEVTTSIVRDASTGKPTELISVFRDITERKRAEVILNARLEEEHEFQGYLKALHEITIELTHIDELDAFYQRAVELGLARLGFERLAMFLYNEKDKTALGTYGTDTQGKVVDERHVQFAPNPNGPMLRAFNQAQRFYFDENVPLYNDLQPVGFGWNAAAVLWNGTRSLGWFVADNLLYQTPASKPLLNAMGLYALTVGTLLVQKQVQIELRESEARYRLLAENITDVVMCTNAALECVYISPSSQTVLGYEPAELVGQFALTHIHPDDLASIEQALAASMQQDFPDLTLIVRYRHKQGHYVWLESTGQVIRSEKSGEVEGFISSSRDISKRKEAEEALRESEEKFRLLLDAAPVATIISDQRGRITLVNIQAETLFGFTRAELVGQGVEILVPEYAHDLHVYNRTTYMAAPRVRQVGIGLEVFARRKDDSAFPVEIELSYIQTKDGILVMSFVLDITERRRIAAELESQRSFLRSVIDVSPSMIFVKDYNARFVLVNPMTAKLYNTTVEALIGKTDADFNPSLEEVDHYLAADRRVIDTGELLFVEEPITNFAGETHWLQTTKLPIIGADGKSTYVLGVATDITERRRADAALQASEEKYRRLVETMQGGLAIFDLDDRITYVNDRFCELMGYARDELIGTRSYDYTHDTNVHIIDAQLERRRNLESSSYEILVRHKEGRSVHLLVSASPLLDKNGEYSGSFAVTTDISAQKQAEATLQQALAQEKELGELKSRFVSMASHEFRTPLATILALTETLSAYRHKLSEAQIEQRFDKIKDQVGHLRDIMEDVLLLARMQARRVESNPVNLDLDALCRTVLDEFQNRADVKHRLNYECSESGRKVTLDPKLMRQIISNLVSNAIKYSADDKPIHITLEFVDEAITIKVCDKGIGIPEADLKHLFDPFHRAANVGNIPGTGLGLVITRESVELLGGTIAVESQVARGTTFTIHIPIST